MSETAVPDPFRCDVVRDGARAWVRASGELDLDTTPLVDAELTALRESGCGDLVLDLRPLTFMDSTGLRLVIRWHAAADADGFRFGIVPGSEAVQRVFRMTGMDERLVICDPGAAPAA